jgi:hypothetical protein
MNFKKKIAEHFMLEKWKIAIVFVPWPGLVMLSAAVTLLGLCAWKALVQMIPMASPLSLLAILAMT